MALWLKCKLYVVIDEPLGLFYDCSSELHSSSLEVRIWPKPLPGIGSKEIITSGASYSHELCEE